MYVFIHSLFNTHLTAPPPSFRDVTTPAIGQQRVDPSVDGAEPRRGVAREAGGPAGGRQGGGTWTNEFTAQKLIRKLERMCRISNYITHMQ